jgi:hypothetical protein
LVVVGGWVLLFGEAGLVGVAPFVPVGGCVVLPVGGGVVELVGGWPVFPVGGAVGDV